MPALSTIRGEVLAKTGIPEVNSMAGQKPMWKAQAGAVSVALWENQAMVGGRSMRLLKATVERRYKDGEEWKSSGSFGRNDIPLVLWCLSKAFGVMLEKAQDDNGEDAPVA